MPNQLNKNKNKLKEKDEIRTTHLILAQQAEHRRRFQQIANGHRSTEELLKETRQRLDLVEEAREEFLNLHTPREENPDERGLTRTARSAEGAREWSELFVQDTLPERTALLDENPSSPNSTTVENKTTENNVSVQNSAGVQNNARVQNSGGVQNSAGVQNNASTQVPQPRIVMLDQRKNCQSLMVMERLVQSDTIRHAKQFGRQMA